MLRWLSVLGALALASAVASAQPGPAPRVSRARIEKGNLIVPVEIPVSREEIQDLEVEVMGVKQIRKVRVVIMEMKLVERARPVAGLKVYDLGGKEIDLETATRRLARTTPVLVSPDGRPIDPAYRRALNPGVLVLVLPPDRGGPVVPGGKLPPLDKGQPFKSPPNKE